MATSRPYGLALISALSIAISSFCAQEAVAKDAPPLPQPLITLPIDLENNRPATTLEVMGHPLNLLLDTGASRSLILATGKLHEDKFATVEDVDVRFPAFNQLASGVQVSDVEFRADGFTFKSTGALLLKDNQAMVRRLATKMDGILGRDFFRNYVVAISASEHTLRLYPAGTDMSALYDTMQPVTLRRGTPYIVHRSRMPWEDFATTKVLMLDTGYPGGVVLWDDDQFNRATNPNEAASLRAAGKGIMFFGRLRFGQLVFNNIPVFISNHTPAQEEERQGIIGATMLAPFDYAIDLSSGKLWLTPNMSGLYAGFRLDNKEIYTPGDEEFIVKDFRPPPSMQPKVVVYGNGGAQAGGQP